MKRGFSLIEVILAVAIFAIFATGIAGVIVTGFTGGRQGEEQTKATQYAAEGLEAVRSIKNQAFGNLVATASSGVTRFGGVWSLFNTNNTFEKYIRTIAISNAVRDSSGNIVASGGTDDLKTKKVTSTVSWAASGARNDSVVLSTYLSDFRKQIARPGMLVYGDGGTVTDAIKYQIISENGDWLPATAAADIDGGSTNQVLQTVRLYASATRNEKILVSRHYNGATQYIYAQVYDGTTWGSVQLLSSWNATTFLDVLNFDGTYLANGDFMAAYSDNTTTPKFRIWNGTAWSAQVSLQTSSGIPNYIVTRARLGTNEVMYADFNQANDVRTQYFNGGTYTTGNWTLQAAHATTTTSNTFRRVDFAWSPNNSLLGGLSYVSGTGGASRITRAKMWTANGTGGGSWSAEASSASQGTTVGSLQIATRNGITEWITCNKDTSGPTIRCFKFDSTPAFTTPTGNNLGATQGGLQKTFDFGFEVLSGDPGLIVYSDATVTPKYRKYTASTSTFDPAASGIPLGALTPGTTVSVSTFPLPITNDDMVVWADTNLDLFTILWDGSTGAFFTTPAGRAATAHGVSGSATTNYWYDFSWDNF